MGSRDAFRMSDLSDERVDWIDRQLTAILCLMLVGVRDAVLPDWLLPCRPAIENAFET